MVSVSAIKGGFCMSEMRKNKLTQEWIIYAENRQKRPYEFEKNFVKALIFLNFWPIR